MVIAMIFRGHLLPYSWLYNSNSYLILSIIIPILSLIVGLNFANYFLVTMMIVLEIIFSILLSFENKEILKNLLYKYCTRFWKKCDSVSPIHN